MTNGLYLDCQKAETSIAFKPYKASTTVNAPFYILHPTNRLKNPLRFRQNQTP